MRPARLRVRPPRETAPGEQRRERRRVCAPGPVRRGDVVPLDLDLDMPCPSKRWSIASSPCPPVTITAGAPSSWIRSASSRLVPVPASASASIRFGVTTVASGNSRSTSASTASSSSSLAPELATITGSTTSGTRWHGESRRPSSISSREKSIPVLAASTPMSAKIASSWASTNSGGSSCDRGDPERVLRGQRHDRARPEAAGGSERLQVRLDPCAAPESEPAIVTQRRTAISSLRRHDPDQVLRVAGEVPWASSSCRRPGRPAARPGYRSQFGARSREGIGLAARCRADVSAPSLGSAARTRGSSRLLDGRRGWCHSRHLGWREISPPGRGARYLASRPARRHCPSDLPSDLRERLEAPGSTRSTRTRPRPGRRPRAASTSSSRPAPRAGSRLAFNLPVLAALTEEPKLRALYLYPTKALAQDQVRALDELQRQARRVPRSTTATPRASAAGRSASGRT